MSSINCLLSMIAALAVNDFSVADENLIHIEKVNDEKWIVEYRLTEPTHQLEFKRTPNNARADRWVSISSGFQVEYDENKEFIRRVDKEPFTSVSFRLPPAYQHLPMEYAPFSPFSDSGTLFHSGRFFVCEDFCTDEHDQWLLKLNVAENDFIVVDGKIMQGSTQWLDQGSGSQVYVGPAVPQEDEWFISLVDPELPEQLLKQIETDLPELMSYFSQEMGPLTYRPALFASYSPTDDGTYGYQGGVLPKQIFMHWYGSTALERLDSDSVFWFFAHEVAHLYQRDGVENIIQEEAWLHEGAAEFFAGVASAEVKGDWSILEQKLVEAKQHCSAGLEVEPVYSVASGKDYRLHYSCGLLLMNAIHQDLAQQGMNVTLFSVWNEFSNQIESGQPANALTFTEVIKTHISDDLWTSIRKFVTESQMDELLYD